MAVSSTSTSSSAAAAFFSTSSSPAPPSSDGNAALAAAVTARDLPGGWAALGGMVASGGSSVDHATHEWLGQLLEAEVAAGNLEGAVDALRDLVGDGFAPNAAAYDVLLSAAAASGDPGAVENVLGNLVEEAGFEAGEMGYTSILDDLVRAGELATATLVMRDMAEDSSVPPQSWANNLSLLQAYATAGNVGGAREIVGLLQGAGVPPSPAIYRALLNAHGKAKVRRRRRRSAGDGRGRVRCGWLRRTL